MSCNMTADINQLPEYTPPPTSNEDCKQIRHCLGLYGKCLLTAVLSVDYVELVNLDLAKFDDPAGRQELAKQLFEAATGYGFLTLSNHGITDEVYQRQMRISNAVMTLSPAEKEPYEGDYVQASGARVLCIILICSIVSPEEDSRGLYVGFKPAGPLGHKGGFPKQLDHYNILVHDPKNRPHPEILRPFMEETKEVMHYIRNGILMKLLKLVSMILEVPEEAVLRTHAPGGSKTEYIRYVSLVFHFPLWN